ncbi:MAG: sialate O-acetylesterase [Victivallaceae bacterium]|jgi:sialate O-acetylesterase
MRNCHLVLAGLALMAIAVSTQAEVKMPSIFGSNMVLQREKNVPVWGWEEPKEKVTVRFNGQTREATADESGKWQTALDPMPAGGPFKLEVSGTSSLAFDNVMVGEVWLCSGQSNMQMAVKASLEPEKEIAAALYPEIRIIQIPNVMNNLPQNNVNAKWLVCSPETIPGFSAAAYFFGREIYKSLKIPVGLINSSWGGTRIEPWTPPAGFQSVPELKSIAAELNLKNPASDAHRKLAGESIKKYEAWLDITKKSVTADQLLTAPPVFPPELLPYQTVQQPTVLYNAMINPLAPFALRGAIWYQGESNRGEGMLYFNKMQALINGWRTVFNNSDLAFYFVQLAPYNYGNNPQALAEICEAQVAALSIPNTGMAVTMDIGNIKDIHPKNKQEVGRRLALQALNKTYRQKEVVCDSPLFDNLKLDGGKAVITFKNAVELKTRDGKAPDWFEIAGEEGVFKKADAVIAQNTVTLSAAGVEKPLVVRFAWDHTAEPNLVNEAGLPAAAFRAGKLPETGKLLSLVPEARDFKLVYALNPVNPQMAGQKIVYTADKRREIIGEISRIAYYLELRKADGGCDYVFVALDQFTQDISKIGVPDLDSKAKFQQKISNMLVKSNVAGIKNGTFAEGGNMEFWGTNYSQSNSVNIPGASSDAFDFGDKQELSGDYGSMQIHNYAAKQTLFAFNNWKAGRDADLGIGNAASENKDWTFARNSGKYAGGKLMVLVKTSNP